MRRFALVAAIAALSGLCIGSAAADQYTPSNLTAVQILAKAREATGSLATGAYVVTERSHGGGVDDALTTRLDGDDYVTVDTTGSFVDSYGSFKGQSWSQDENGTVLLHSDFVAHTDPNILALEHPEDPQYRVTVRGITTDDPRQYVVELNPPGGSDQYRYYDAKTMLLTRVVTYLKDRHKHVFDYGDYRTAFGETRAYHTHYSDGRSDNDTDSHVVSVALDPSPQPLAIPPAHALYALDAPVQLPVQFTKTGIVVRATIGGRGLDFVLDSGASAITLDPGIAHDLGISPYGKYTDTDGGEVDQSRARIPKIRIGDLTLSDVATTLVPMDFNAGGSRVVGLLGCDFIAAGIVGVDFHKETVTLYPRATFDPKAMGATASAPIDVDDCIPRMHGTIDNVAGSFLIDIGSFETILYRNYFDKLKDAFMSDQTSPSMLTVGGALGSKTFDVPNLVAGPISKPRFTVAVPDESTWNLLDYDGVFGRNLLSDYVVLLDYAGRTVYFKPAR